MKPIPVVILSYNRPALFNIVIKSFGMNTKYNFPRNKNTFPTYLVIQDWPAVKDIVNEHVDGRFPKIKKYYTFKENKGAAAGYNKGMEMALEEDPDYILFLEDDWASVEMISKKISLMIKFMDNHPEVGQMRLRARDERVSRVERMTGKQIVWEKTEYPDIHISNAHWTFNPCITRASVVQDMIPTGYGLKAIRKYFNLNMKTAKYGGYCFTHIGYDRATTVDSKGRKVWIR